ncbi:MAG: hypothetical protein HS115_11880 [Spirochaetales bacterium]|nr:hypothetical protein [Spirochaetales bacterium]
MRAVRIDSNLARIRTTRHHSGFPQSSCNPFPGMVAGEDQAERPERIAKE